MEVSRRKLVVAGATLGITGLAGGLSHGLAKEPSGGSAGKEGKENKEAEHEKEVSPVEDLTITTPFDMTVLNDLDRFHLVMDTIDRLPQTGDKGIHLKQQLKENLIEHKQYIDKHGEDMPEIRYWKWGETNACKTV